MFEYIWFMCIWYCIYNILLHIFISIYFSTFDDILWTYPLLSFGFQAHPTSPENWIRNVYRGRHLESTKIHVICSLAAAHLMFSVTFFGWCFFLFFNPKVRSSWHWRKVDPILFEKKKVSMYGNCLEGLVWNIKSVSFGVHVLIFASIWSKCQHWDLRQLIFVNQNCGKLWYDCCIALVSCRSFAGDRLGSLIHGRTHDH